MSRKQLTRTLGTSVLLVSLALTAGCAQIQESAANVAGAGDRTLSMLSASAGEPLWTVDTQPAGSDGPLIVDDTVVSYVVQDGDLKLAGFDLASGEEKWVFDASTGASTFLPIEAFVGDDGTAYVVLRNTPEYDEATNFWRHPILVIQASTGVVVNHGAAEWWTAPTNTDCVDSGIVCMVGTQHDSTLQVLGVNETGTLTPNPNTSTLPQLQITLDYFVGDNFITGVGVDDNNIGVFVQNGEAQWDIELAELGLPDTLTRIENNIIWSDGSAYAQFFRDEGVVLIDATYRDSSTEVVVQQANVTALDAATGEVLWTTAGELCLHGIVCEGENSFIQEKDGSRTYNAGAFNLVSFDLRTGERKWETSLEGMQMYSKVEWEVAGDNYAVLALEDGNKLMKLDTGELLEISDEQRFGCWTDGLTFTHHRSSRPDLPLVEDTSNIVSQSCGSAGANEDLTSFTQNVVASRSSKPLTAGDEWNVFDEQVRVIATSHGIHAYEF